MAQRETISSVKSKVHWFVLPLLFAVLGWLLIGQYESKATQSAILSQQNSDSKMNEKVWNMLVENHQMLQDKADQKVNEHDHQRIIEKLNELENVVGKAYGKIKKYSNTRMYPDTIFNVTLLIDTTFLQKQKTFLTNKSNFVWSQN